MTSTHISGGQIRVRFAAAMSAMYRKEVPDYGTLIELVDGVNEEGGAPTSDVRHGAIRVGTAGELAMMRRAFGVMDMHPVAYYDLSPAGVPVHSTAFRPVGAEALAENPLRIFTSLLRLDLIADEALRETAARVLADRRIFTEGAIALINQAEREGGLSSADADRFVAEIVETFRWHEKANIDAALYERLNGAHRLLADIVAFRGPHINHLTLHTRDIDEAQARMPGRGLAAKAVIEGPPARRCPVLLRQTSFKALEEPVSFTDGKGGWIAGSHTARFGEIEQRGIALTPKGRALYDKLLADARSASGDYEQALVEAFRAFPDDWSEIRRQGLGYFTYSPTGKRPSADSRDIEILIAEGAIAAEPITYEDFLPVSAAGIFRSNLGDEAGEDLAASPNRARFEEDLGTEVLNEFEHYRGIEAASLDACLTALRGRSAA